MVDGRVFIWEVLPGATITPGLEGSEAVVDHMGGSVVMSIEFVVALWHFPRRIGMVENCRQA